MKVICTRCGGTNIACEAIVNPNTGKIIDYLDESFMHASCEGCVFNNSKNYYCKDTHCIDVDRKDDIDVIYKEVKRS